MALTTIDQKYRFRDLGLVPPGHFSPVGISQGDSVFGTYVSVHSGESCAVQLMDTGEIRYLSDSLSLIEAVGLMGDAAGSLGFGERAFRYTASEGLTPLGLSHELSSATCLGPNGEVGGSVTREGQEIGALFVGGEIVFLPQNAKVVQAISQSGLVAGKTVNRDCFTWRPGTDSLKEFSPDFQANWIAGFLPHDVVILTVQQDTLTSFAALWEGDEIRILPGLGGQSCRVVSVGYDGSVLLNGTDSEGTLCYGIWTESEGTVLLDRGAVDGLEIQSLNAIGSEGRLVGLASGEDGLHLIVGHPAGNQVRAVVELES